MRIVTSKLLILPILSLLALPGASFAKSTTNVTQSCPNPATSCPQTMEQANTCGWQTLPDFPVPSDPLSYMSGPTSEYDYSSVCMYQTTQAPFETGLYYAGNSNPQK